MSREDQYIGLNGRAEALLNSGEERVLYTETVIREFPNGEKEESTRQVVKRYESRRTGETFSGMFGDKYPLHEYAVFGTGKVYIEYVQAEPWASGPMFFLALKDEETGEVVPESLWTDEEMDGWSN